MAPKTWSFIKVSFILLGPFFILLRIFFISGCTESVVVIIIYFIVCHTEYLVKFLKETQHVWVAEHRQQSPSNSYWGKLSHQTDVKPCSSRPATCPGRISFPVRTSADEEWWWPTPVIRLLTPLPLNTQGVWWVAVVRVLVQCWQLWKLASLVLTTILCVVLNSMIYFPSKAS